MGKFKARGTYVLHGRGGEMSRHGKLAEAKAAAKDDCGRSMKWKHDLTRDVYDSDDDYSIRVEGATRPAFQPGDYEQTPEHPRWDCAKAMRKKLIADLDAFVGGSELPRERDWRSATHDARADFPSAQALRTDDWGSWLNDVTEHVYRADGDQVDIYFREKYNNCPVCGETWTRHRRS
jgi:hypothetical protein